MKRLLVLLLFITVPVLTMAEIHGFFECGYTPTQDMVFTEIELQWWMGQGIVQNELYGGFETWSQYFNHPFKTIYSIGDRIHINNFYLQLEYGCNHAVYSEYSRWWWAENLRTQGNLTTVSIGVEW